MYIECKGRDILGYIWGNKNANVMACRSSEGHMDVYLSMLHEHSSHSSLYFWLITHDTALKRMIINNLMGEESHINESQV